MCGGRAQISTRVSPGSGGLVSLLVLVMVSPISSGAPIPGETVLPAAFGAIVLTRSVGRLGNETANSA